MQSRSSSNLRRRCLAGKVLARSIPIRWVEFGVMMEKDTMVGVGHSVRKCWKSGKETEKIEMEIEVPGTEGEGDTPVTARRCHDPGLDPIPGIGGGEEGHLRTQHRGHAHGLGHEQGRASGEAKGGSRTIAAVEAEAEGEAEAEAAPSPEAIPSPEASQCHAVDLDLLLLVGHLSSRGLIIPHQLQVINSNNSHHKLRRLTCSSLCWVTASRLYHISSSNSSI